VCAIRGTGGWRVRDRQLLAAVAEGRHAAARSTKCRRLPPCQLPPSSADELCKKQQQQRRATPRTVLSRGSSYIIITYIATAKIPSIWQKLATLGATLAPAACGPCGCPPARPPSPLGRSCLV
jgi:hypothetical protein